jgi:hypothetical protein
MNILSLGTPLFSSSWRAAGHRVLVLADIAQSSHEDNLAFDFFSHPDTCARRFGAIVDRYKPDVIFQGDHSAPLIHCGLEDMDIPKAWYSIDSHLHMSWHKHYAEIPCPAYGPVSTAGVLAAAVLPADGRVHGLGGAQT